jgi:phosphocarrier protein HPr
MPEIKKEIEIVNRLGMHARPAARLVQLTSRFSSDIIFKRDSDEVNGKSIMGVLMLASPYGSIITVIARGDDAEVAVDEIEALFRSKFGED